MHIAMCDNKSRAQRSEHSVLALYKAAAMRSYQTQYTCIHVGSALLVTLAFYLSITRSHKAMSKQTQNTINNSSNVAAARTSAELISNANSILLAEGLVTSEELSEAEQILSNPPSSAADAERAAAYDAKQEELQSEEHEAERESADEALSTLQRSAADAQSESDTALQRVQDSADAAADEAKNAAAQRAAEQQRRVEVQQRVLAKMQAQIADIAEAQLSEEQQQQIADAKSAASEQMQSAMTIAGFAEQMGAIADALSAMQRANTLEQQITQEVQNAPLLAVQQRFLAEAQQRADAALTYLQIVRSCDPSLSAEEQQSTLQASVSSSAKKSTSTKSSSSDADKKSRTKRYTTFDVALTDAQAIYLRNLQAQSNDAITVNDETLITAADKSAATLRVKGRDRHAIYHANVFLKAMLKNTYAKLNTIDAKSTIVAIEEQ